MFAWGEDGLRGFRLKDGSLIDRNDRTTQDGAIHYSSLGYHVTALSAGHSVLAFVKSNGNSFIIRTAESRDGRRVRGKQKFVKLKEKIQAVSCTDNTVLLLSDKGTVLCVDAAHIPRTLEAFAKTPVSQVACGSQHSVALTRDGQVYTWGQDSRGQLGLGKRKLDTSSPQHLRSLSSLPLVQIAAGGEQSFALSVSGGVFSWGRNDHGQLGLGDRTDRHIPTSVHCLNMKKSVQISCGKDHTAILTKTGSVFSCGSSQYGQLGHNSFSDELRPRIVTELWGAKVTHIACGRYHTLVLTEAKKVYSFGRGEQGQLGHRPESHPSVPLPVHLSQGNCSFATCISNEENHEESNSNSVNNATQYCLSDLIDKWTSECDSKSWKKTKQEIHKTLSSAACVNRSFLEQSKNKHFQTSVKYSGLNLSHARRAFKKLVKQDLVLAEVQAAILHLLPFLDKKPLGVEGLRIYLLLIELLDVIQKYKRQQASTKLAEAVATAVLMLSADSIQVIGDWWSSLSRATMVKHVKVWKQALSVIMSYCPVPRNNGVRNLLHILQYMYNANSRIAEPQRMPESDFYLLISENFLKEELQHWFLWSENGSSDAKPLILCSFPIVMDLQSKKRIYDMHTGIIKIQTVFEHAFDNVFWMMDFGLHADSLLELYLRRSSILDDTFEELAATPCKYYKLPLAVYFDENYIFDEVYKKDFFYGVFHEMVSPESGMFMFNDSKTLAWFTSTASEEDQRYYQFGVLCGLALYNQCIIHLPFPLALFKKLLGVKPSLEDLMEFDQCLGKSLQYILEEDDDIDILEMDFSIPWDGKNVDLDPENPKKAVTGQNKKEFVDAYVSHVFNASVQRVFHEFQRGFFQVCDRHMVKLFRPKELQEVLVGKDFHDWEKLKENTRYTGEFHADHPTIQMFWEVFDELSEDEKKAFLWFVTGFEREPILGLKTITMTVDVKKVEDLSYDNYYPETHTCFSTLELPLYSTKEVMVTKLTEALSNNRGIFSHPSKMFAWGDDCEQGFRLKNCPSGEGVHFLNLSFHIRDLSAGRSALAFVKSSGEAFIIRTNENQDGRKTREKQKYLKCPEKIRAVSCTDDTVTLLSERGTVFCVDIAHTPFKPQTPEVLCNIPVLQVACGNQHSLALTKDGQVYTWGRGSRGQLGLGERTEVSTSSPQLLRSLSSLPLVQVAAGGEQSFALSVSGGVFSWGRNDRGQLGLGDRTDRHKPTFVRYLNMKKAVWICCGKDHTVILTKDGAVFTCGSDQYGQLGHNSFSDELRPRLVAELWGAKVTKIACGRHHTLVLTDSNRVYSFGCGEQGQLGSGAESRRPVPLHVQLPPDTGDGAMVRNIFAGENCSFALCTSAQDAHEKSSADSGISMTQHSIDEMVERWTSECDPKSLRKTKQEMRKMFSSASCMNQSFLDRSNDKHFQTSSNYSGLNLSLAQRGFEKLAKREDVLAEIMAALLQLLPTLEEQPVGVEGLRVFLLLNELLFEIQRYKPLDGAKLAEKTAAVIRRLSSQNLQVLVDWWFSLAPYTMVRHVKAWTKAFSGMLSFHPAPRDSRVKNLLHFLQRLHKANNKIVGRQRIPEKTFGLEISQVFLQDDLHLWVTTRNVDVKDQPFILCNFPFLMDMNSKILAFKLNAGQNWMAYRTPSAPFFELKLMRESLTEQTFRQLEVRLADCPTDLWKPLVVYFNGDPDKTDVYKRDFFQRLFRDLVSTKAGMFLFNDSETLAWFPACATEEDQRNFYLFGILCGLALYNQSMMDLPFPLALFKKLLGVEPTLEDMKEFSNQGRVLQEILDYEDEVLQELDMDFVIFWDNTQVDLDPRNPRKPVTSQNKKEFVDAYVNYVFNTSVDKVFQEFQRGFFQMCARELVKLFRPEELQGALVGQEVYNWKKLKQNTLYEPLYHAGHPTIQMFWEVFDELTEDQRKNFIWFLTGFKRAPILGMDHIQLKIREKLIQSGSYDDTFPESLTCHSILELPSYSTKEIMKSRLTKALKPKKGFLM
ncbi:uncharacterized protein V6R79_026111 [Siganus canaliculatus]